MSFLPQFIFICIMMCNFVYTQTIDGSKSICFHGKAADEILQVILDRKNCKLGKCKNHIDCVASDKTVGIPVKKKRPTDCGDIDKDKSSGIYTVYPKGFKEGFDVYCDMETDNGGWTVFQRRVDKETDFYKGWKAYRKGFGNLKGNFWLGNSKIHALSSQSKYKLRIDLEDFDKQRRYATYSSFSVGGEKAKYKLTIGKYMGNAGDSLSRHNGRFFSTKDSDNDKSSVGNCAALYKGAWWYEKCHDSNLNALYLEGNHKSFANGINWRHWRGRNYSLKKTVMMMKRVQ